MLSLELKRAGDADMTKSMLKYIEKNYTKDEKKAHETHVKSVDDLRKRVMNVKNSDQRDTAALNLFVKYYDQLCAVEKHFPISEAVCKVQFKWHDSFKGSKKASQCNIHFEKASVLHNIAAVYTALGSEQDRSTGEGLKTACHHFQTAAGVFRYLQDHLSKHLLQPITTDLTKESFNMLELFFLAQAQQCFFEKAVVDNMKPKVVSKLAAQTAEFYRQAGKACDHPDVRLNVDKTEIPSYTGVLSTYFRAVAHRELSKALQAEDKYGEAIGRLHLSDHMGKEAARQSRNCPKKLQESIHRLLAMINEDLAKAISDNDKIYCDMVPKLHSLSAPEGAAMVKPVPPPAVLEAEEGKDDPFIKLVPLQVHNALTEYNSQVEQLVNKVMAASKEYDDEGVSQLISMNLPDAIDNLEKSPENIPHSVSSQLDVVAARGGYKSLKDFFGSVENMAKVNLDIFANADSTLKAREGQNAPVGTAISNLRQEAEAYRTNVDRALNADEFIQKKFKEKDTKLQLLMLSKSELQKKFPPAVGMVPEVQAPVSTIRGQLKEWESIKATREQILSKLLAAKADDDILSKLTGSSKPSQVCAESMKTFTEFRSEMDQTHIAQTGMFGRMRDANGKFEGALQANENLRQRDELLRDITSAIADFNELMHYLSEGMTFYTNLQEILSEFNQRCALATQSEFNPLSKQFQNLNTGSPNAGPRDAPGSPTPKYTSAGYGAPQAFDDGKNIGKLY
eukprot:GFYU01001728.1.p1 GENE.GFYU01001728.1~~GFYU01001728.1.p1  ORF type:complete len:736 (-),score=202.72 GFYU01001728.1:100-2307(-)